MGYDGWFRLAHELKKHLHNCLGWRGPVTHRQHIAWLEWFEKEKNEPSRSDHYMMAVRLEIRAQTYAQAHKDEGLDLKDFKIPFKRVNSESAKKMSVQEASQLAIARAIARTGGKVTIVKAPKVPKPNE